MIFVPWYFWDFFQDSARCLFFVDVQGVFAGNVQEGADQARWLHFFWPFALTHHNQFHLPIVESYVTVVILILDM